MDWTCVRCGAAWAPGAPCCPHCRGLDYTEGDMPKATVEGGASDYAAGAPADGEQLPVPEAPSPRAPKAELVEHAVAVAGVDPEAAQAMTKTELVETIAQAAPPPAPPPPPPPGG